MLFNDKNMISIIGVHKSATTSIFDYMIMHKDICGGLEKEIHYYTPLRYNKKCKELSKYEYQFKNYKNYQKYLIDASPSYLYGKESIIREMKKNHNKNKIILVLRNPTDRFISFYKYLKSEFRLDEDISFIDFQNKSFSLKDEKDIDDIYYRAFREGEYVKYLEPWLKEYDKNNFKIIFFDEIKQNNLKVVKDICNWLNLDSDIYNELNFEVKNKTINNKNKIVHLFALKFNKYFEYFFRKNPSIKSLLKKIYYKFNGSNHLEKIDVNEKKLLDERYKAQNKELKTLLEKYNYSNLPKWLKDLNEN